MIFNDINILIDFGDFLKFIQQGNFKDTFTWHVRVVNSFCSEQGLQNIVISVEVTDFSVDKGNQNLENIVFWDSRHQLQNLDLVLLFVDFLPHVAVGFLYLCTFDKIFGNVAQLNDDVSSYKWDDTTQGITESFVQSGKFLDEVKTSVSCLTDLGHEIFIMISTETERVNWEDSQLFLWDSEHFFEGGLSSLVLTVRKQKYWSYFIDVFSFLDGFQSQFKAWTDVCSTSAWQRINVFSEWDHVLRSNAFQAAKSLTPVFECNDWQSVGRGQSFEKILHGAFHELNFLPAHWSTDVDNANKINTGSWTPFGFQGDHGRQHDFFFEFSHRALSFDGDFDFGISFFLLDFLDQSLVIVENIRLFLGVGFKVDSSIHATSDLLLLHSITVRHLRRKNWCLLLLLEHRVVHVSQLNWLIETLRNLLHRENLGLRNLENLVLNVACHLLLGI